MPGNLSTIRTPPHDRTYGIEVECFVPLYTNDEDYIEVVTYGSHYGFFVASFDGSIDYTPSRFKGVEFVSQPLPKEWLKKEIYKLYNRMIDVRHNESCGIHVHVSKKWCTGNKAKRIRAFIATLTDKEYESVFGREPNSYCQNRDNDASRYRAVNVENEKTVEFRMFRSGNETWASYCVDMADYLVRNNRNLNKSALFAFADLHSYAFE